MSSSLKRVVVGTVAAACVLTPAAAMAGGKADKVNARMTGGGHVMGVSLGEAVKVTHGFSLYCRTATQPQRLQINWSGGNSFHLTNLVSSSCTESSRIDQENPDAPIDTYNGKGTGRLNFGSGEKDTGTATWRFVDGGEPGGGADRIRLKIVDSDGDTIVNVVTSAGDAKPLVSGNHQAHRGTGSKA
jgi:hypothetical protein